MPDPVSGSPPTAASAVLERAVQALIASANDFDRALAEWLRDEIVSARHAEDRAAAASNEVYSNVAPAYTLSTERAVAAATAYLTELSA